MGAHAKFPIEPAIPDDEDLLTMKDVLARTKFNRATIYRKIAAGTFPAGRSVGGNSRRWTRREFRQWVESCESA